ncbi:MAG: FtsX-like permease family protein [Trebonia sp.]
MRRELALGMRFAASGGTGARIRTALTIVGVSLAVAVLLLAAAVPSMWNGHYVRDAATTPQAGTNAQLLLLHSNTSFHGQIVNGFTVQAAGPRPPLPPGTARLPGPGQMLVSPALRSLLAGPSGKELLRRLGARVVGIIGASGLTAPDELSFVRGSAASRRLLSGLDVMRVSSWGVPSSHPLAGPVGTLLVIVMLVALLTPVVVFIATAARFGGEDRDRRLAALRLVGADMSSTAMIAAGETLLAALIGLLAGCALFFVGRVEMQHISIAGVSIFSGDVNPSPVLVLVVLVLVPACAVAAALAGMRKLAVEPLGVSRHVRGLRRRLWWRCVPPVLGVVLLLIVAHNPSGLSSSRGEIAAAVAVAAILVGVTALLPWAVEWSVARAPGGPLPWLLAIRRLREDAGTAGRVVGAIGLAVAGAIALQTLFGAVNLHEGRDGPTATARSTAFVTVPGGHGQRPDIATALRSVPGVRAVSFTNSADGTTSFSARLAPGQVDALDHLEDRAAEISTLAQVTPPQTSDSSFRHLEDILTAGAIVVLLMIGASAIVSTVEGLRERRAVLAALAAFGTPRSTIAWSVLWQTVLPLLIGLLLAVCLGSALGALLTDVTSLPMTYAWGRVSLIVGAGAGVGIAVTLASLPLLWRLMAPAALRVE